jgi:hypothetical protein
MFDDTLMVEIDHALDVYCLLQGRMPAGARHMRNRPARFAGWLYWYRRQLFMRIDETTDGALLVDVALHRRRRLPALEKHRGAKVVAPDDGLLFQLDE